MKHTPGPWFVYRCSYCTEGDACGIMLRPEPGDSLEHVLFKDNNYDECNHILNLEDAHLIAAAPRLLAALRGLVEKADEFRSNIHMVAPDWNKELDAARALLAELEGEHGEKA